MTFLVAGGALLLAVVLPPLLHRWAISAPLVLVAVGALLGLTPLSAHLPLDPSENRAVIEHVTELAVIVALMGVGLALDRPFDARSWRSWRAWSPTWRLLLVAMPLGIAGVALLGWWWAGLAPAAAVLLGAALAPTDPVLASDVQVAGPQTGDHEVDETDEVRFTLTSEAGLNDGLAFPFVYLAVLLASGTTGAGLALEWVGFYVVVKIAVGVGAGFLAGRLLGAFAFRSRLDALRVAEQGEPLLAVAALVAAYGVAEVAQGYGFLAVFACAMTLRAAERTHRYHEAMHEVVERLERLLTLFVLLVLGIALTRGQLEGLDLAGVAIAVALVFVVRPLTAYAALAVRPRPATEVGGLTRRERLAASFFGVRGVGSLYYLAYAVGEEDFAEAEWLFSTVVFTVVLSVVVHGVTATPAMRHLESSSERAARERDERAQDREEREEREPAG
nr:cation:proton antiporter [Nocardioides perillae]